MREKELELNRDRPWLELRLLREELAAPLDVMVWHNHAGVLIYGESPIVLDIPGTTAAKGFRSYLSVLWSKGIEAA